MTKDLSTGLPLGATPRFIWVEHRLDELTRAINRYVDAGVLPLQEWLDERQEHRAGLEKRNCPENSLPWAAEVKEDTKPEPKKSFFKLDTRRSPLGFCVGFEDGLDGFVIHADACSSAGKSWSHGSSCIGYSTWRGTWPEWAKKENYVDQDQD